MTGLRFRFRLIWMLYAVTLAALAFSYAASVQRQRDREADAARRQLNRLVNELYLYQRDVGEFPTAQQGLAALLAAPADLSDPRNWHGPYERWESPIDPWSHPYNYERLESRGFRVWSDGPDGRPNTDDDMEEIDEQREGLPLPSTRTGVPLLRKTTL